MAVPGRKAGELGAYKDVESEELWVTFCQPCLDEGQQLPVAGFCVDCCEYLCKQCYTHHCTPRQMKHHVLQDKSAMPRNKSPEKTLKPTGDKCPQHQGEIVNFYCRSHDQLGCGVCFATSHKKCDSVSYVEEEYEELQKKLTDLEHKADNNASKASQNVADTEKYNSGAMENIRLFRSEINIFFDKLENDARNEVIKFKDEDQKNMGSISTLCDAARNEIHLLASDLVTLHKSKQNAKLFTAMDRIKIEIKKLEDSLSQIQNDNVVKQYQFEPERRIHKLMGNQKTLGKMTLLNAPKCDNTTKMEEPKQRTPKQREKATDSETIKKMEPNKSKPSPTQVNEEQRREDKIRIVTHITDINTKVPTDAESEWDDRRTTTTGSALLPDNQIVIVDGTNHKVILVDIKQKKITCYLKLSNPWDITTTDNNQVAVTFPQNNTIQFLSVASYSLTKGRKNKVKGQCRGTVASYSLTKGRQIKVEGQCRGIKHNDGTLIVTFVRPGKVEIIKMNGTVLRSMKNDANGVLLFDWPQYVIISPDKTAIYVSDYRTHKVTCLTLDGTVKAAYEDHNMKGPNGLAIDKAGSVFVCGSASNNIHQITAECTKVQILLGREQEMCCPHSLTYCDREDKLYVGQQSQFINNLKVFQIS